MCHSSTIRPSGRQLAACHLHLQCSSWSATSSCWHGCWCLHDAHLLLVLQLVLALLLEAYSRSGRNHTRSSKMAMGGSASCPKADGAYWAPVLLQLLSLPAT
jgi:hypothetical protein